MVNGGHDQISQNEFFSRLLSKEGSKAEASSRVLYYGGSSGAAVPFMWESQPGTPKHPLSHSSLPPLTPPPSYQSNKSMQNKKKKHKDKDKITPKFLATIFASKKCHVTPSLWPSSSSTSSSSWSSSSGSLSFSSPSTRSSSRLSKSRSSTLHFGVDHDNDENEQDIDGSRASAPSSATMCFGARGCGFPKGYFWNNRSKPNVKSCTV